MLLNNLPSLDLHGESKDISRILVNEFIEDNYKLGNEKIVIIHGKGKGIIRKEVENVLKKNKKVKEYKLDFFNDGCTTVVLDKKSEECYNTRHLGGGY